MADRVCPKCQGVFPATAKFFYKSKTSKNGCYLWCKRCASESRKEWQKAHTDYMRQRGHNRKMALVALLGGKCIDCGFSAHFSALDFDHKDPKEKCFVLSGHLCYRWSVLAAEAMKCELRCANCHRIRTFEHKHSKPNKISLGRYGFSYTNGG